VTMLVYCTPLMGGWSISHASWDVDAVHGVHAMYSVSRLGTACGQPDTTGFFRTQLPSPGLQTVSITAVKTGSATGHQVCVFHHRRQDGQRGRPSGVRFHHRRQDTGDRQPVAIAALTRRDMHKPASSPSAVNRFWPHRTIERLIRRLKTHPDRCRTGAGAQHLMGEL
jgi:hypothetical protein